MARIRTRQRAPRLIAFVAGKGGVGNTTTAAGVALALDALRHDSTAIVDAQHGAGSIARRLADRAAPTASQLTERTDPDPIREPLRLNGSLGVVDGSPWHDPQPGGELVHLLEQLGERFAFTVVDLGDDLGATSGTVLRRVDQVVVVTSPTDDAVTATGMAIRRIYQAHPYHLATVVVALACVGRHPYRPAVRRLNDELGVPQNRIIPVPFDPLLAVGRRIEPAGLRPATREAYLRLGGLLAAPATPDQGRQAHPPAGTPR